MPVHVGVRGQSVTQSKGNVMSTEAECSRTFAAMKQAVSASYAASRTAGIAKDAWDAACRSRAITQVPELVALMANVERLELELATAKQAVKNAAGRATAPNLFRRWFK